MFRHPPTGSATQVTIKLVRTPTSNKGARVVKVISASQVKQEVSNSVTTFSSVVVYTGPEHVDHCVFIWQRIVF